MDAQAASISESQVAENARERGNRSRAVKRQCQGHLPRSNACIAGQRACWDPRAASRAEACEERDESGAHRGGTRKSSLLARSGRELLISQRLQCKVLWMLILVDELQCPAVDERINRPTTSRSPRNRSFSAHWHRLTLKTCCTRLMVDNLLPDKRFKTCQGPRWTPKPASHATFQRDVLNAMLPSIAWASYTNTF